MRDLASCFNEYAIQVSDTSCTSYSNNSCISPSLIPSIQNVVSSLYKTTLSNQKQLLITVSWCKNSITQGPSISFGDDPTTTSFKLNTNSRLFKKKKGSKLIEFDKCKVEVIWDLAAARYQSGPEPLDGYYVLVIFDSQLVLLLGDLAEEAFSRKVRTGISVAKFSLISRQEHFSGNTLYSTKARFCDNGESHDIIIRCSGENEGSKCPVLSICIDKKTVIRIKRLQWNFRGNQTIFVDGLLIDLMWDVHDWFYNPASGYAVFMFRTRSGMDSRLWLEEKWMQKDEEKVEFSLLICACKSP